MFRDFLCIEVGDWLNIFKKLCLLVDHFRFKIP